MGGELEVREDGGMVVRIVRGEKHTERDEANEH